MQCVGAVLRAPCHAAPHWALLPTCETAHSRHTSSGEAAAGKSWTEGGLHKVLRVPTLHAQTPAQQHVTAFTGCTFASAPPAPGWQHSHLGCSSTHASGTVPSPQAAAVVIQAGAGRRAAATVLAEGGMASQGMCSTAQGCAPRSLRCLPCSPNMLLSTAVQSSVCLPELPAAAAASTFDPMMTCRKQTRHETRKGGWHGMLVCAPHLARRQPTERAGSMY